MSSIAKMCVMSMDETSLNPHLFYKCSKDMVSGLEAEDLKTYIYREKSFGGECL